MPLPKVTVLTVTYGKRWPFLSQVIETVMKDEHVTNLVIVDNGSQNKDDIESGVKKFGDKVLIIRHEKNLGSAGGFAAGLAAVREIDCDFVFILDDDNVPEEGAIAQFLEIRKFFPDRKIVLSGNRVNLLGSQEYFFHPPISNIISKGTFFEICSFSKIRSFFRILLSGGKKNKKRGPFIPIVPNEGFTYGGSFLPIEAIRESSLPDASLVLYGDDIEYSWGVIRHGYTSYLCTSPKIYDVDLTFGNESHLFGVFDYTTSAFKVYYRIRNMVLISIRNTQQNYIWLLFNIFIWVIALFILGISKYGPTCVYFSRVKLIILAVYSGIVNNTKNDNNVKLP